MFVLYDFFVNGPGFCRRCKKRLDLRPHFTESRRVAIGLKVMFSLPAGIGEKDLGVVDVSKQGKMRASFRRANTCFILLENR